MTVRQVWFLRPTVAASLSLCVPTFVWFIIPAGVYRAFWGVTKEPHSFQFFLIPGALLAFLLGVWAVHTVVSSRRPEPFGYVLLARGLAAVAIVGYIAFAVQTYRSGIRLGDFINALQFESGAISGIKRRFVTIPGVTTATQFGPIAAAALVAYGRSVGRNLSIDKWAIGMLIAGAAARGLFFSERLALVEMLVPLAVVVAMLPSERQLRSPRYWHLRRWAPVYAFVIVLVLFTLGEYGRSWTDYYSSTEVGLAEFGSMRLLAYYALSINNFLMLAENGLWDSLYHVAPWVPGGGADSLVPQLQEILAAWANPEFNNSGGLLTVMLGHLLLGLLALFFIGFSIGFLYAHAKEGKPQFVAAYACLFVGLLEFARVPFLLEGRTIPIWIGVFILIAIPRMTFGLTKGSEVRA